MPWVPCELNGKYRCRRAVGALACFLSHLSGKRRSKCDHRPAARWRRYTPFDPHGLSHMPKERGLSAAVLPPPQQFRTPVFARHILADSPLKTELPGVSEGLNFGAHARQVIRTARQGRIIPMELPQILMPNSRLYAQNSAECSEKCRQFRPNRSSPHRRNRPETLNFAHNRPRSAQISKFPAKMPMEIQNCPKFRKDFP
jgi:hypothetical protein